MNEVLAKGKRAKEVARELVLKSTHQKKRGTCCSCKSINT